MLRANLIRITHTRAHISIYFSHSCFPAHTEASRTLESVLRANLINAIGIWADSNDSVLPEVPPLPSTCVHSTRLRSAGDNVRTGENVSG